MSALTRVSVDDSRAALVALVAVAIPVISWRHHGIGVLQGYLIENTEPEVRIHIWDPELVKGGIKGNGDVHDHRFDMTSHVIFGNVVHEEWHEVPSPDGPLVTTILTHARAAAHSKYHGPTVTTENRYFADVKSYTIPAGFKYTYPAKSFHCSPVTGLAITVVEKHNQRSEPARILHPMDSPFVPAFGHDENPALLVRVLNKARAALGLPANHALERIE